MYITVDEAKEYIRQDGDYCEDDKLIASLIASIEAKFARITNNNLGSIVEENGGDLPADLRLYLLSDIATAYNQRENTSYVQMYNVRLHDYILQSYIKYHDNSVETEIQG
jgi:Phage QLRG family, putative DNA packaging.